MQNVTHIVEVLFSLIGHFIIIMVVIIKYIVEYYVELTEVLYLTVIFKMLVLM